MAIRSKNRPDGRRDYDNAGSAVEVSAFKKGLLAIDLQTIRERLAGKTITRKWKRELVEAEFARRTSGDSNEGLDDNRATGMKRETSTVARFIAAAIIMVCSMIILYALYEYLVM